MRTGGDSPPRGAMGVGSSREIEEQLEAAKQKRAEQGDFNLMDAFQMIDERNLGWVSAPPSTA